MVSLLTFTVCERPHYLRRTLESWAAVRGLDKWEIHFSVEPTDQLAEVVQVLTAFGRGTFTINDTRLGVARNPYMALARAFEVADFAVLAEEDIIVADDILEYFAWARDNYRQDRAVATVCARSNAPAEVGQDPALVRRLARFEVQTWGTWADRWEETLRPTWDFDYSTFTGTPGHHAGWDWNINERIIQRQGLCALIPAVSRVSHIGIEGGVHTTAETAAADASPSFVAHHDPVTYRIG